MDIFTTLKRWIGLAPKVQTQLASPRCVLTLVDPDEVNGYPRSGNLPAIDPEEPYWVDALQHFYAVSPRVCMGTRIASASKLSKFYKTADKQGCRRFGWGYHYLESLEGARAEAQAAAEACRKHSIVCYFMDPEKQWFRSSDPEAHALEFIEEFKKRAPGVTLAWNGLVWKWVPKTVPLKSAFSKAVASRVGLYAPMIYNVSRHGVANKWSERLGRWSELVMTRAPMVGVGRVDSRGLVWGFSHSKDKGSIRGPGLVDLVARDRPPYLCFYYGNRACGAITRGNKHHAPLIELVPELHRVFHDGVA